MLFKVDSIKNVHVDKGEGEETETWITSASDREGNKVTIVTSEFFGLHPEDEIEVKKKTGQSTIKEITNKDKEEKPEKEN